MISKLILLFILFSLLSSKIIPSIELGVNTTLDMDNTVFNFEYNGPGKDLILMYIKHGSCFITYTMRCGLFDFHFGMFGAEEKLELIPQESKISKCKLNFTLTEGDEGSFIIYTLNQKLSISLKNQYGMVNAASYEIVQTFSDVSGNEITFSVPNLDRDVNAIFNFSSSNPLIGWKDLENPFKVCHKNDCLENLYGYEFKKGESYKIMVKVNKCTDDENSKYIIIPGFTFYDQNYNGDYSPDDILDVSNGLKIKLLFISLILLFL